VPKPPLDLCWSNALATVRCRCAELHFPRVNDLFGECGAKFSAGRIAPGLIGMSAVCGTAPHDLEPPWPLPFYSAPGTPRPPNQIRSGHAAAMTLVAMSASGA